MASKVADSSTKIAAKFPTDDLPTSFLEAIAVSPTNEGPNVLQADLKKDWRIGQVPAGGYIMSVLTSATHHYFTTHHSSLHQPDLITIHTTFLSRCIAGPCTIRITDLKLGRQFSTVRVQLFQHGDEHCLEAVVTQGNLAAEKARGGLSLPTRPMLENLPDRRECVERKHEGEMWDTRPVYGKTVFLLEEGTGELQGHVREGPSVREMWTAWRDAAGGVSGSGEALGFGVNALPYLCDNFRPLVEAYGKTGNWFPTMGCSVEVKKAPPEKGWEWLFVRVDVRVFKDGRHNLDVVMMDEDGDVVALARQTALAVSAERNRKVKKSRM